MNLRQALTIARDQLNAAGIFNADLEAEALFRHVLSLDRAGFFERLQDPLAEADEAQYEAVIQRRLSSEPTAYIVGHREFYGLDFELTTATLIPRPETEHVVEAALDIARDRLQSLATGVSRIVELGTGCGAVAITLIRELPSAELCATDISGEALEVARRNAGRYGVLDRIDFRHGDLLEPLDRPVDLIVANLPYVTYDDWVGLPPELRDHEPRIAFEGGADGMDLIRRLLLQAPAYLRPGGAICLEFGTDQAEPLKDAALESFADASFEVRNDLAGLPRVLVIQT